MKFCAVIPAAGKGSRLGADRPKILVPVKPGLTIWDLLSQKLEPFVDQIHVIVSPDGKPVFEQHLAEAGERPRKITVSIQPVPRGMGDAIFSALPFWGDAENILIIWGDQLHVSEDTLRRCREAHLQGTGPRCTLPVVSVEKPYVEYVFSPEGALTKVLQSREGDVCSPGGLGDVGTFLLSTEGLGELWQEFVESVEQGALTGELNFLPFLTFLSEHSWSFQKVFVEDPDEAMGINTQDDLAYFRNLYS